MIHLEMCVAYDRYSQHSSRSRPQRARTHTRTCAHTCEYTHMRVHTCTHTGTPTPSQEREMNKVLREEMTH